MPTRINIITNVSAFTRGFTGRVELYPLMRWRKALQRDGYRLKMFQDHRDSKIFDADIILLHHRYHEQILIGRYSLPGFKAEDVGFIIDFIEQAKRKGCKVVILEGEDSGQIWEPEVLAAADMMLKKQVYKDKSKYLQSGNMPWLPERIPLPERLKDVPGVREEDLDKIQIGWNIGLCDYRSFPHVIRKYYPLNSYTIKRSWYDKVVYSRPDSNRPYLFSYRGGYIKGREIYNYNRNMMHEELGNNKEAFSSQYLLGGKVSFNKYMQELRQSLVGLSPFGWGEVCHRDFEIFIAGGLMVKPDMSHLATFPDIYEEDKTYVPVKWDYSDLIDKLLAIERNYEQYIDIAQHAQAQFREYYESYSIFKSHLDKIISRLASVESKLEV